MVFADYQRHGRVAAWCCERSCCLWKSDGLIGQEWIDLIAMAVSPFTNSIYIIGYSRIHAMRIKILGIGFCLTAVILLQGCYFWSSEISNPEITSSYRMDDFDYHDYVGYDESSQQEFILYIEKNYLNDLRAKIITENITLPSITLYEFTHRALAEKYKDPEFMETKCLRNRIS